MAAYAALVSLQKILDDILHHPAARRRLISHNRAQLKSLREKVNFLQDFLQNSSSHYRKSKDTELDGLETMIRDAAYKAEDVIESDISNQLLAETETVTFRIFPRFLFVYLFILALILKLFYMAFQKVIALWIQILIPVMCVIPISVQSLLPVSFQNVIFIVAHILIPLTVHVLVPFSILNVIAAGAEYVVILIRTAVPKGISFVARYLLYGYQPKSQGLCGVIDDISLITNEVVKIKDVDGFGQERESQRADSADGLSRNIGKTFVVGLESDLNEICDSLIGPSPQLKIVSIVGMGGIGKTTLARQVHDHSCIVYHFDICAWVAVSQEYSSCRVMLDLLRSAKIETEDILQNHRDDSTLDQRLGEHLYRNLMYRRYLIVMDDVWDTKIWDFVKRFFPDNHNGSRVLLTSRHSEVASYTNCGNLSIQMRFLDDGDSWHLLREKVFRGEGCPPELEAIGRTIARDCRGLPLAITVVGGLLYNRNRTVQDWTRLSENLSKILSNNDEQCMEILGLSYKHLPHRLKPCFLYMGAFREDEEIRVSRLFNLWAAEGFVEASKSKSLEEVAEEYLKDLVQRSLVLVGKWSCNGKIATCKIHDLLREVCLLNAQKENFLDSANRDGGIGPGRDENRRRVCIHYLDVVIASDYLRRCYSMARSFIYFGRNTYNIPLLGFRLLRVLDLLIETFLTFPDEITELFHLRYLGLSHNWCLPRSISRLWNLQTIVYYVRALRQTWSIPVEIWSMPNLRYLYFMRKSLLPDPPSCHLLGLNSVLENLHTLVGILDFRCTKSIIKSLPNLKKLSIFYYRRRFVDWSKYQLENLASLHKLESLEIAVEYRRSMSASKLAFPEKLKKLSLSGCKIPWESMAIVGTLPNLQVLKLRNRACEGQIWEPVEGEFCQLKFLLLEDTDLVHWRTNETHWPLLQCLILRRCYELREIPSGLGEIPTLERMEVVHCHTCAVASAKLIREEQQNMGNEDLKFHIEEDTWT